MSETRKRPTFTFPVGLGDSVEMRFRMWDKGWESGAPVKGGSVVQPHPREGDDNPIVTHFRRKFRVPFKYNEVNWLTQTLNEENPEHPMSIVFAECLKRFETLQERKEVAPGVAREFDFSVLKADIAWVALVLARIRFGRPTPAQEKFDKDEIGKGNW